MARRSRRLAFAVGTLTGLIAAGAAAQGQVVYRYVDSDGRVVYSDHQPPASARQVEAKRLSPNLVETDQISLAAQRAQDRFPVTLYTFACGDVCDRAEALLNRRGVPYTTVNVQEAQGAEKLQNLTGELQVPVLQVGEKMLARGFLDSSPPWRSSREGFRGSGCYGRSPITQNSKRFGRDSASLAMSSSRTSFWSTGTREGRMKFSPPSRPSWLVSTSTSS